MQAKIENLHAPGSTGNPYGEETHPTHNKPSALYLRPLSPSRSMLGVSCLHFQWDGIGSDSATLAPPGHRPRRLDQSWIATRPLRNCGSAGAIPPSVPPSGEGGKRRLRPARTRVEIYAESMPQRRRCQRLSWRPISATKVQSTSQRPHGDPRV